MSDASTVVDAEHSPGHEARPRRRRRWSRRRSVLCALLVIILLLVWAAVDALLARQHLARARDRLTTFANSPGLSSSTAQRELTASIADVESASSLLGQPSSWLVRHIPLLGRSWVAEDTVARAAGSVLTALRPVLRDSSGLGSGEHVDLAALERLHHDLAAASAAVSPALSQLADLNVGLTPGPVGTAVREAQAKLLPLGPFLTKAAAGTSALDDLLGADGPHTILIVLQNNAELRATGGLIGSFAVAHSSHGVLHVGRFRDADQIELPAVTARQPGQQVPAPADYARTYGPFLANTTLLKNANFSPSVSDVSRVLSELIAKRVGPRPDAVMFFDAPAVAGMVNGAGTTVHLPSGANVTGDDLVRELLVTSYQGGGTSAAAQQQRHKGIERAADAALKSSLERAPSYGLLRAFGNAVAGRHLTIWSQDPSIERELVTSSAAGSLSINHGVVALASADNLGDPPNQGNKLDYYAHRSVAIRAALTPTRATVSETVTVHNDAPTGLGPYVEGPNHPGRLSELWSLLLPADAHIIGMDLNGRAASAGREPIDGESQVMLPVATPRGATSTISLEYTVPLTDRTFRLTAVPQPLALPATLSVAIGGATRNVAVDNPVHVTEPFHSVADFTVHVH